MVYSDKEFIWIAYEFTDDYSNVKGLVFRFQIAEWDKELFKIS